VCHRFVSNLHPLSHLREADRVSVRSCRSLHGVPCTEREREPGTRAGNASVRTSLLLFLSFLSPFCFFFCWQNIQSGMNMRAKLEVPESIKGLSSGARPGPSCCCSGWLPASRSRRGPEEHIAARPVGGNATDTVCEQPARRCVGAGRSGLQIAAARLTSDCSRSAHGPQQCHTSRGRQANRLADCSLAAHGPHQRLTSRGAHPAAERTAPLLEHIPLRS